ncbi:High cysteine protein [Giardia muris]|uniref:High cysteine protein n=1 Tax=Giardia muris TaxID=5742 RepID=A0A4Z1T1B6_GIAMU|nr:High cysteine protein [Giardia muris]|eukprot:TNJ26131.1 High cysteine protein [Giardia muris]
MLSNSSCLSSFDADKTGLCARSNQLLVGEALVCKECKKGSVPIDGTCLEVSSTISRTTTNDVCKKADGKTPVDGTATRCENCSTAYFLFEGGCYPTTTGSVGSKLCSSASNGQCSQAASGSPFPLYDLRRLHPLSGRVWGMLLCHLHVLRSRVLQHDLRHLLL